VWYRFIGRTKLKYTNKETMRLTLRAFRHEYKLYKNDFDLELLIKYNRTTYGRLEKPEEDESESWDGVVIENLDKL
jgi:hypothetical protein